MKKERKTTGMLVLLCAALWINGPHELAAANPPPLLNDPVDISGDFHNFANLYYLADKLADFDPATGKGEITYQRSAYFTRLAFDNMLAIVQPVNSTEFPGGARRPVSSGDSRRNCQFSFIVRSTLARAGEQNAKSNRNEISGKICL